MLGVECPISAGGTLAGTEGCRHWLEVESATQFRFELAGKAPARLRKERSGNCLDTGRGWGG